MDATELGQEGVGPARKSMRREASTGVLYIVGTPIGNLRDITVRALQTLRSVDFVLAEDTRRTSNLLKAYRISKPLMSFHEHSGPSKVDEVLSILKRGASCALVSDAGMPVISDPGSELVRRCRAEGIAVEVVPGPSAVTSAVALSGFPGTHFYFVGFMPKDKNRRRLLRELKSSELIRTIVFFESPERIQKTLRDVLNVLGDVEVCVARELTKYHEEVFFGTVSEAIAHFQAPLGEFTIVLRKRDEQKTSLGGRERRLGRASVDAEDRDRPVEGNGD